MRYGDLLQLAIGRFGLASELPPYVEDFVDWVTKYRYGAQAHPARATSAVRHES